MTKTVRAGGGVAVHHGLEVGAAYAWRLLVLGAAAYAGFVILGRLQLVAVALFLALVVTSVLRPLADLLARWLPRTLAVVVSVAGSLMAVLGLLALVGELVAREWDRLGREFSGGIGRIERWLLWRAGPPSHDNARYLALAADDLTTTWTFRLFPDGTGEGEGPDGAVHRRFRTWKEALRDAGDRPEG